VILQDQVLAGTGTVKHSWVALLENMEPKIQETLGLYKKLQRIVANTKMSLYHK
jgi:hypothetical protein